MKYVLVKYKTIKLLINEGLQIQPLIDNLAGIEQLNEIVTDFYKNVLTASKEDAAKITAEQQKLTSKIGYKIIGVPFTNHDAELYAANKRLDYEVLELHGNTGKANATKDKVKESQIQMRVSTEQKAKWVKMAQKQGLKLSEWISGKCNDEF